MFILRVVNKDGLGMYMHTADDFSLWDNATDGADDDIHHPCPWWSEEMINQVLKTKHLRDFPDYFFGFLNKRQLLRWIYDPEWRQTMTDLGGKIRVYKVHGRYVASSPEQAMFPYDKAELIDELPVNWFDQKNIDKQRTKLYNQVM